MTIVKNMKLTLKNLGYKKITSYNKPKLIEFDNFRQKTIPQLKTLANKYKIKKEEEENKPVEVLTNPRIVIIIYNDVCKFK